MDKGEYSYGSHLNFIVIGEFLKTNREREFQSQQGNRPSYPCLGLSKKIRKEAQAASSQSKHGQDLKIALVPK